MMEAIVLTWSRSSHSLQIFKKSWIRLRDAAWVLDDDARDPESDQGHAHGHAVIVVGLDLGAVKRAGMDRQAVVKLVDPCADATQLSGESSQTVSLLVADVAHVANRRLALSEASDRR